MLDHAARYQLSDETLRRFGASFRGIQLYSRSHPIVSRNIDAFVDALRALHEHDESIVIALLGDELIVGEQPMSRSGASMGELIRRLKGAGIERIAFARGVTPDELRAFVEKFGGIEKTLDTAAHEDAIAQLESESITVGRVTLAKPAPDADGDIATIRRLYAEAVSVAGMVWESARADEQPDPASALEMIDGLAQAVARNRAALLALTALKEYDNYTFTHMVNVSILTMAQARGLGIEGATLKELGMAALMHDIGKVRTPPEILNKPDSLTSEELAIMKRHTIDGAEILRATPDIPPLAPIVAFEHHLRLDGTGYPDGVSRPSLNLATMLCGIADVYDAMRSQRKYQQAFASERILAVLQGNDGSRFDQNLVRRFVQLLGIYPTGSLVRLDTGEIAVVLRAHAPDPYRPKVRVLFDRNGVRVAAPREANLWETANAPGALPTSVAAPVDPADYEIDPLAFVQV